VEGNVINGDIFISVDRVKENSKDFETSFDNEILRILIHGVLHLLGYKDKAIKDKHLMTVKEDLYLKLFNDSYLLTKNV
jgi:rRNA maturation RNase YbeY